MIAILLDILAPILLMILLGAIMRWKFALDLASLSKITVYLLVPAFTFDRISTSSLSWGDMGGIVTVSLVQITLLAIVVWGGGWVLGVNRRVLAAVGLAVLFYNSGNFGLPLAELAYGGEGAAVQTFVMMTQNILTFTVGLTIAGWVGAGSLGRGLITVFRLPILPAMVAGLSARWWLDQDPDHQLPRVLSETARFLAGGLIPVMLITLGAQLASNPRWPRWRPVSVVLLLRLVFAPMLMAAQLWFFHWLGWQPLALWPWPAEVLILTAAVPSAINILLLTLELEGDADLAADCIFWTTVCSGLTISAWLVLIGIWGRV